jgi:predicted PurR-regulated permease PerM
MNAVEKQTSILRSRPIRPGDVVLGTLFVALVAAGFWLLIRFRSVFLILFIAIVLSTAITPLVEWLRRRGLPKAAGVILIYLLLVAIIAGFIWLIAPLILDQVALISRVLPQYYSTLIDMLRSSPSYLIRRLGFEFPTNFPTFGLPAPAPTPSQPGTTPPDENPLSQVGVFFHWFGLTVRGLLTAIGVFFLAFYWTLDSERTIRSLLLFLPVANRENVRELFNDMLGKVGSFVLGQIILCASIGAMSLGAYWLIGLPYALLLAMIAGLLEAVPVFGPTLGVLPAVLVAVSAGQPSKVLYVILAAVIIQQMENHLLVPRVYGKAVGVNPVVTLLALFAFASLFGLMGAVLAIPLAAIIQLVIDRYFLSRRPQEPVEAEGRGQFSLLRMEIQELAADVRKQVRDKDEAVRRDSDQAEDSIEAIANDLDSLLAEIGGADGNGNVNGNGYRVEAAR